MKVRGLLHHVLTSEIVTARVEHRDHDLGIRITNRALDVAHIGGSIVFLHKGEPLLVFGRVLPLRISRIFREGGRDDANAFLESC